MIIDIETVVFRQPVVQIGVLPEKLLTRVREADGWLVTLDTEAGEVTLVESKGEPICVPSANVLCYTRRKVAAPVLPGGRPIKPGENVVAENIGGFPPPVPIPPPAVAPKNLGDVVVALNVEAADDIAKNKAANARGKR